MQILRNKGLKVTPQRIEILRFLDEHRVHPTADDIYRSLKKTNPSLSKTTVYNSLDVLTKKHVIQCLTISLSEHRYDFGNKMHHHFFCYRCGRIYDLDFSCPNIKRIRRKIIHDGHRIEEAHGYFRGVCKNCLEKEG